MIGIIGILSSIVLASLQSSRSKGLDSQTEQQMAQLKRAAELYFLERGSYGDEMEHTDCHEATAEVNIFTEDGQVKDMLNVLKNEVGGDTMYCAVGTGPAGATAESRTWAIAVPQPSKKGSGTYFCLDSSGNRTIMSTNSGSDSDGSRFVLIKTAYALGLPPPDPVPPFDLGGGTGYPALCS